MQRRSTRPKHWINDRIRATEVRVVTAEAEMLGVMPTAEALEIARGKGLDLVEISPKATPPVCKIIDYGKLLYEQKKKEKAAKKATKASEIKGIRLSFRIGVGDLDRQRTKAEEFLTENHPIRIQMVMRGREKAHKNLAFEKIKTFVESLSEFGILEQLPKSSGFQIIAVMKPKGKN